jgi:4-hydroxy-tetrahydrodipicolinate reductase
VTGVTLGVMVIGAAGRMGSLTAATVAAQPDMCLAALVDTAFTADASAGEQLGGADSAPRYGSVAAALAEVEADAAVDFTVPSQTFMTVQTVLAAGVDAVVGTSGLTTDQLAELDAVRKSTGAHLFVAPNFALGAVLLMRFAQDAARYYAAAEIVESHHPAKVDAPSGTALRTADLMRSAPGSLLADRESDEAFAAHAGRSAGGQPSRGLDAGGIHIHSVRLPGLVAHQEVVFGGAGEVLTIRHDSLARESFMAGVLLALRSVGSLPGTVVGLEHLMT